jgi:trans-aconitate methyltransferase
MDSTHAEFDACADNYYDKTIEELGEFGKYRDTALIYKAQLLKYILKDEPRAILDFGCGIGLNIPYLHTYFKNTALYGCDVSSKSIEIARKKYPYGTFNVINNVEDLQIYNTIDCVFISTVLHHIPEEEHEYWINGLYAVLTRKQALHGGGGGGS